MNCCSSRSRVVLRHASSGAAPARNSRTSPKDVIHLLKNSMPTETRAPRAPRRSTTHRARGADARLDRGRHRCRGSVRGSARIDAAAAARPDARGRVGRQRPDRDPARDRLHRGGPESGLRRPGRDLAGGVRAGDRRRGRDRGRRARRDRPAARDAALGRPVPGGVGRVRGPGLRRRRHDPRLRLPRRVPGRARHRQRLLARPAHGDHVPRRARVGRAARALPVAAACSSTRPS